MTLEKARQYTALALTKIIKYLCDGVVLLSFFSAVSLVGLTLWNYLQAEYADMFVSMIFSIFFIYINKEFSGR